MHPPMGAQTGNNGGRAAVAPHNPIPNGASHCFDDSVMVRWLQSAGLHHLAAPLSAASLDHRLLANLSMQDHAKYGAQSPEDKHKMSNLIKPTSTVPRNLSDLAASCGPSSSLMQSSMDGISSPEFQKEFSPGIFDIHAIDTELLPEASVPDWLDSCSPFIPVIERGFENELEAEDGNQYNLGRSLSMDNAEKDTDIKENLSAKIRVVVRKRPINKKELARKEEDIISVEDHGRSLTVHEPKLKVDLTAYVEKHEFIFDAVLDENVSNDQVYRLTVEPIVPTIFQRTKATCFAYGQTGSGKTYTMQPLPLKASQDILHLMQQPEYRNQGYQLWLSFFEIYGGKLFDLLNERSKLCMREDGRQQVCIVGLKEYQIFHVDTLIEYIEKGTASRSTGMTGANEESSRSHAILQLSVKKVLAGNESKRARMLGKLSFIDLAGSERGADTTDNDRQTRLEGAEINKSLLALKECIRALDSDQGHIPFRGSKLTEVLRDSFVGDSRTVMISCISPSAGSCEHTLNTLRYADRVKGLSKNKKELVPLFPLQPDFCASPLSPHVPHLVDNAEQLYLSGDGRRTNRQNHRDDQLLSKADSGSGNCRDDGGNGLAPSDLSGNSGDIVSTTHVAVSTTNSLKNFLCERKFMAQSSLEKNIFEGKPGGWPSISKEREKEKQRGFPVPCCNRDKTQSGGADWMSTLKEENDLVSAHCKQVEDTIEIVHEEMGLIAQVDQPGSQIREYISQLNRVLSRKAAGLVNLQARLARFQQRLQEQEILRFSSGLQPM